MLAKLACANIAGKVIKSGEVIYLSRLWWEIFFSISLIFVLQSVFLTKLLTLSILFSTAVKAVVVAKIVTLGIWFSPHLF